MKTILLLFISILLFSCEDSSDETEILQDNMLIGFWINPTNTDIDSEIKYDRSDSLKENQSGISFLTKNVFIERHFGWCATPPLVFNNHKGTWSIKNSTIDISINNFLGELNSVKWKIKFLDEKHLILEKVN